MARNKRALPVVLAPGVTTVGTISGTSNANGATITGNTINLAVADATNGGSAPLRASLVLRCETFAALITGQAGLTVSATPASALQLVTARLLVTQRATSINFKRS